MFFRENDLFSGVYGPSICIVEYTKMPAFQYPYLVNYPMAVRPAAQQVIDDISKLLFDWDGYGGLPTNAESLSFARNFIASAPMAMASPEISPNSYGTISLEWQTDLAEAYLDIGRTRYSGHIRPKYGNTIYLEGKSENLGYEEMAVINQLLYATSGPASLANSSKITQSIL
jgi:hypothetical protein